jgi:hypothetical protein
MRVLVLDPRNGDSYADLFVVDIEARSVRQMKLGYVPELSYDPVASELLLVETEIDRQADGGARYWLKGYAADTLELAWQVETPPRPMYSGFPGRSTRVLSTPSGRYVYVLECGISPKSQEIYRITPHRYDRVSGVLEAGRPGIDSCMIEFGQFGASEDDLFFHLSCDFPSTVMFVRFSEPAMHCLALDQLAPRTHSTRETCGSWFDRAAGNLYCISMEGSIHRVELATRRSLVWTHLALEEPRSIPIAHLFGAGDVLFAGVAVTPEERCLGLASEIWCLSTTDAAVQRVIRLPFGIMNFVAEPGGRTLYATSPSANALCIVDAISGDVAGMVTHLGWTPAEVQLLP